MAPPLRLKAIDREDLIIIASCLQDALVLVGDMVFVPDEQRFILVANRFGWETPGPDLARVTCGVTFSGVIAVKKRGFDRRDADQILSLLTLRNDAGAIDLVFSGGAAIRLECTTILAHLEDVGEAWPTQWRPSHVRA